MKFKAFIDGAEHDVEVQPVERGYHLMIDGTTYDVDSVHLEAAFYSLIWAGRSYELSVTEAQRDSFDVRHGSHLKTVKLVDPLAAAAGAALPQSGRAEVTAVMPGRVVKVNVEPGQQVEAGQSLLVLEAMKMENDVTAPQAGCVREISVAAGQTVESGALMLVIE